ncbi:hypothetical protein E2C01_041775 [Portunus trituberculatus]|uniref:Uncharacterized protein n=1 Tax=Portunus trituberculatus TaxID=210409 RepID=A0A5B7FKR6_PORTR|nr:hypothetical protein [Portunus trituberculatus]
MGHENILAQNPLTLNSFASPAQDTSADWKGEEEEEREINVVVMVMVVLYVARGGLERDEQVRGPDGGRLAEEKEKEEEEEEEEEEKEEEEIVEG